MNDEIRKKKMNYIKGSKIKLKNSLKE